MLSMQLLFNCPAVSNSFQPHGLQHAGLPCPSSSAGGCSNSCPLSQWCHLTILFSVIPFSSCHQSFLASGSFLMTHLFSSGGQSIIASASASVLLRNIQGWFPLGLTSLIPFAIQGTLKSLLQHHSSRVSILWHSVSFMEQLLHPHMTTGRTITLTIWTFVSKEMYLLLNMQSRMVCCFMSGSNC